jgi:predicted ATPase
MNEESSRRLRFTRLALENWKNFTKVDVKLQRRAFLVGPNASGKSNFLDAFRFFHDIVAVGGGFQESVRRRRGVSAIRSLAARRVSEITLQAQIGTEDKPAAWEYELSFTQDSRKHPVVKRERVLRGGKPVLERPNEGDLGDPKRLTQTYLEQVNVNREFREVAGFFASITYLHIVPQLVREPDRSVGRRNDPFGGDFLEQIAQTPKKTQRGRLSRILQALRVAVPQLRELKLEPDSKGDWHLRGKYEHWRPQGAWQSEEQFSDGTLRLLGLLWALLEGEGPLLLEEPELSLHSEVVRFLPQMLARLQRRTGRQVLISTHSPDLLRDKGIALDEVLLLLPTGEGTVVRSASDFLEIPALLQGGLTLAEAVIPKTRPAHAEQVALFADL